MLIFREPTESDFALMADSFWRGAIDACPGVGRLFLVSMLERAIRDPSWHMAIMCDDGTQDEILCWGIWKNRHEVFWIATSPRYQLSDLHFGNAMFEHIGIKADSIVSCVAIPRGMWATAARHNVRLLHRPYMALT